MSLATEVAAISTKPTCIGSQSLDFRAVRAGALGSYSCGFNRQVQDVGV